MIPPSGNPFDRYQGTVDDELVDQDKIGLGSRVTQGRAISSRRLRELGEGIAGTIDLG